MASGSDREYQAAQAMILYQAVGEDRELIKRIVRALDRYGTSSQPGPQRMSDQSFWMWMCDIHADEVIAWEAGLSEFDEQARFASAASLKGQYEEQFKKAAARGDLG